MVGLRLSSVEIVVVENDDGAHLGVVDDGATRHETVAAADLPARVRHLEREHRPRWVWADTAATYGRLVRDGARAERCYALRLSLRYLSLAHCYTAVSSHRT